MSFVSKGEKIMRNKAKAAGPGADRPAVKDSFGKKGHKPTKNMAAPSKDKTKHPVSEDAMDGAGYDQKVSESEYDPASGKRAKTVADLRSASKKLNERSMAGEASPTGKEGGQEGKHSTSKNASGFMGATEGEFEKKSSKKPRGQADQMADEGDLEDPMDSDQEDNEETHEGMTPSGKSRKKVKSLKDVKKLIKSTME